MKISTIAISTISVLLNASPLDATFSIAAVDQTTGAMGAAGCFCVHTKPGQPPLPFTVYEALYHPVPGKGVLVAQAQPPQGKKHAVYKAASKMLNQGDDPASILTEITSSKVDPGEFFTTGLDNNRVRQYGIVDLQGRADGYTGDQIDNLHVLDGYNSTTVQTYAQKHYSPGAKVGPGKNYAYVAQGNIVSLNTVQAMADGFEKDACDLAERLFHALTIVDDLNTQANATGTNDQDDFVGDVRCEEMNGFPGYQAFVHVDFGGQKPPMHLESNVLLNNWNVIPGIMANSTVNPFDDLRKQYNAWRANNSCPPSKAVGNNKLRRRAL